MKILYLFITTLLLSSCAVGTKSRLNEDFTQGWKFHLSDDSLASAIQYDDSGWRTLDLPHDWSIEADFSADNPATPGGGSLPGGIGWYRKEFVKIHAAYSRRGVQHFGSLVGLHEIYNSSNGFMGAIDAPKLVGDSTKALAVLTAGKYSAALAEGALQAHGQGQVRSLAHLLQIATQGQ